MTRLLSELALLATCAAACSTPAAAARPQVVVVIDTDLPVPPDPNNPASQQTTPALVDTARVEVVQRGTTQLACATPSDCRRDFALDQGQLGLHEVSFGLVAIGAGDELRIRLFRHDTVDTDGEPVDGATDEVRARPVLPASGVETVTYVVPGDDWGEPGASAPIVAPIVGDPPASRVGQWAGAQSTPCSLAPRADSGSFDGETCVAGGAFLRDAESGALQSWSSGIFDDARLVVLSPFLIDTFEFTVARYASITLPAGVTPPDTYATDDMANPWRQYCTLGSPFPDADAYPLNCVSAATADAICAQLGERLPTETETTWVTAGREARLFPWGIYPPEYPSPTDPNTIYPCCDGVVFGRYPLGTTTTAVSFNQCSNTTPAPPTGAYPARPEAVDAILHRTLTGSCSTVRDVSRDGVAQLGGNLSEWTSDYFADQGCWPLPAPQHDPVCPPSGTPPYRSVAGGSWLDAPADQYSGLRQSEADLDVLHAHPGVGFRCARSAGSQP